MIPLGFPHKFCDKSFHDSQKYPASSALQKSAPGSNPRCKIRRFSAKFPLKFAIFAYAFGVFSQPHRLPHFDTPYTSIANNSAPALAQSSISTDLAPQLSLCCSSLLALTVLLCFSLPRRDVSFS